MDRYAVNIHYQLRAKIKELGFKWNKKDKTWVHYQPDDLTAWEFKQVELLEKASKSIWSEESTMQGIFIDTMRY